MLHADGQGGVSAAWKQHRKHVFILSNAGKPIWTLHGDENALAGLMAVVQALVSFVHDKGDAIRSIRYPAPPPPPPPPPHGCHPELGVVWALHESYQVSASIRRCC